VTSVISGISMTSVLHTSIPGPKASFLRLLLLSRLSPSCLPSLVIGPGNLRHPTGPIIDAGPCCYGILTVDLCFCAATCLYRLQHMGEEVGIGTVRASKQRELLRENNAIGCLVSLHCISYTTHKAQQHDEI
jgi:hypothetical protein